MMCTKDVTSLDYETNGKRRIKNRVVEEEDLEVKPEPENLQEEPIMMTQ